MAKSLNITGDLTAAISVRSLEASLKWYEKHLGFKLIYKLEQYGWAEVATAKSGINVGLSQVESIAKGGGATLTFGVKDIAAARKTLESAGVKFDGETTQILDMVKLATFYDPDENALMLFESLTPAVRADGKEKP